LGSFGDGTSSSAATLLCSQSGSFLMTFQLFQKPLPESDLDMADKLDELADSISRLSEVDRDLIARIRSLGARARLASIDCQPPAAKA
jgi:hypothetical protein